jgi:signal transduction histidine kinase
MLEPAPSAPQTGLEEAWRTAAQRRLARLRFDLHDGPQQDIVLLADDIRLLRAQLETLLDGHANKKLVLGRIEDLEARLAAIDGDLRRISAFAESPFMAAEPVPVALEKVVHEFAERSGIVPETHVDGDFGGLTDSQQIMLLGLIREALSNVREHSGARSVTISVSAGPDGLQAAVSDDGRGFDPDAALLRAARGGHMGLVGMHERVRLLGGQTRIDSRPGGPTTVSVMLPPYPRR